MCGIVGIVSAYNNGFSTKEAQMAFEMLYLDTFRGYDSTGVFSVNNDNDVHVLKEATPGFVFIHRKEFKNFCAELIRSGKIFVGHNRAATKGEVSDENAHPFRVDNKLVLVHNGTVRGDHKKLKDTKVDTEAIAHVIAEEQDISKALKKINAAYALVWYDIQAKKLHIIRNTERPLYTTSLKTGAFLFASEKETLDYLISRHNLEVEDGPVMYKSGVLATIPLNNSKEIDFNDIDHTYDFEDDHRGSPFHNLACAYSDFVPNSKTNVTPLIPIDKRPVDRGSIIKTIADALKEVQTLTLPFYPQDVRDDLLTKYVQDSTVLYEVVDYIAVNHHQYPTAWYVIGKVITPENDVITPYIYTIYDNITEEGLISSLYDKLFKGVIQFKYHIGEQFIFKIDHVEEVPLVAEGSD